MSFLSALENSAFAAWVRESPSLWAYPTILFLHTVGLGFVVGLNVAIALRLVGFGERLPIRPMEKLYPVMWAGFWVNAASGTALLVADATTKLTNWVFYVKLGFIAAGLVVMVLTRRRVFTNPAIDASPSVPAGARVLAYVSLIVWAGAITAGRLMAYLGPVSGAPGLSNTLGR